jgi:hypothetical protein
VAGCIGGKSFLLSGNGLFNGKLYVRKFVYFLKKRLKFGGYCRKKRVIAENMYKYNRKIEIFGNSLVLFFVKDYILLNNVIFLIFSVSSNNFWEHCSRVP